MAGTAGPSWSDAARDGAGGGAEVGGDEEEEEEEAGGAVDVAVLARSCDSKPMMSAKPPVSIRPEEAPGADDEDDDDEASLLAAMGIGSHGLKRRHAFLCRSPVTFFDFMRPARARMASASRKDAIEPRASALGLFKPAGRAASARIDRAAALPPGFVLSSTTLLTATSANCDAATPTRDSQLGPPRWT